MIADFPSFRGVQRLTPTVKSEKPFVPCLAARCNR
jgi:hypothetical protein